MSDTPNPFVLSDRERHLIDRYRQVLKGSRANDPIVSTTTETIRAVLSYVDRTQAWHAAQQAVAPVTALISAP